MKYFFISLFFIFLAATDTIYAQTKKQVESVSYICPEDTNVFSSYTATDARKSSREENKNVLYVFSETIDEYFTEQEKKIITFLKDIPTVIQAWPQGMLQQVYNREP